jgi:hypothetical protein
MFLFYTVHGEIAVLVGRPTAEKSPGQHSSRFWGVMELFTGIVQMNKQGLTEQFFRPRSREGWTVKYEEIVPLLWFKMLIAIVFTVIIGTHF